MQRIVCLANSRKHSGRCIAGREISGNAVGGWIRPVSSRPTEEISLEERRFEDGSEPKLLDTLEIQMLEARPHSCQTENHLIADDYYWVKAGKFPSSGLLALCENPPTLWTNGYHSYDGINDRIPEGEVGGLSSSLVLIQPSKLVVCIEPGQWKLQVRAEFRFNEQSYKLIVTHPKVETRFLRQGAGRYAYSGSPVVCVSLGENFVGYRYKLVASIIDT